MITKAICWAVFLISAFVTLGCIGLITLVILNLMHPQWSSPGGEPDLMPAMAVWGVLVVGMLVSIFATALSGLWVLRKRR